MIYKAYTPIKTDRFLIIFTYKPFLTKITITFTF
jgi:hypothetical protein